MIQAFPALEMYIYTYTVRSCPQEEIRNQILQDLPLKKKSPEVFVHKTEPEIIPEVLLEMLSGFYYRGQYQ
jgi:hypothetical protein